MKVPREVLLLFASQKGNAKSIAEEIYEECLAHSLPCRLLCCSQVDASLDSVRLLVLIGSTTGDGDPPDTARRLWRKLHQKGRGATALCHLQYTVLGLGDTNYTNFCNFGKTVDNKLQALGATRFYECGWADDGTGLEEVVEPWREKLIPALQQHLNNTLHPGVVNGVMMDAERAEDSSEKTDGVVVSSEVTGTVDQQIMDGTAKTDGITLGSADSRIPENLICLDNDNRRNQPSKNIEMHTQERELLIRNNLMCNFKDVLSWEEIQHLPVRSCVFPDDARLSLPVVPPAFLFISYAVDSSAETLPPLPSALPSAASGVVESTLVAIRQLTRQNSVKTTLEVTLSLPFNAAEPLDYQPGDSIGVLVKNSAPEVEMLLTLIQVKDVADKIYKLAIAPDTKKKRPAIPDFIPKTGTLRYVFESCLDIRSVPKKPLLRALVEHTSHPKEKRRLQELVSKEGAEAYLQEVREAGLSLLDLLVIFPSCQPPVTTLLEHLPRLLPRPYSLASSPLVDPRSLTFVFNVINIPKKDSVTFSRMGVCTGWLASLHQKHQHKTTEGLDCFRDLTLSDKPEIQIPIYLRTRTSFYYPEDSTLPLVMVGPGTGVAPFLGFLRHRQALQASDDHLKFGVSWLFYGCRHQERDFLHREELEEFTKRGVLDHLEVCFSRDEGMEGKPRYVQDSLVKQAEAVGELLVEGQAVVYVCGDAKNMAKDVFEAFVTVLKPHFNQSKMEAKQYLANMQLKKRYLQDVWT